MKIKRLFENHPLRQVVYECADGTCFFESNRAQGHASGLKIKTVSEHHRVIVMAVSTPLDDHKDSTDAPVNYSKLTNAKLEAELKNRGIDIKDAKLKAELVALLEADDTSAALSVLAPETKEEAKEENETEKTE